MSPSRQGRVIEGAGKVEPIEDAPRGRRAYPRSRGAVQMSDEPGAAEGQEEAAVALEETPQDESAVAVGEAPQGAEPVSTNGSAPIGGGEVLAPAGAVRACPIPAGAVVFGELTSAFVDGPRLLRFLGDRRHTGAVVDSGGDRVQVGILHEGGILALVASAGKGSQRLDALALPAPGSGEERSLTVLTYRPEITVALAQLVNLPERFAQLHGSFVDLPALLTYLAREQASGGVRVTTRHDTGIVLLRNGQVLGAYTRLKPELDDADVVFPLAKAADAEIDVHVGALTLPPASVPVASVVR